MQTLLEKCTHHSKICTHLKWYQNFRLLTTQVQIEHCSRFGLLFFSMTVSCAEKETATTAKVVSASASNEFIGQGIIISLLPLDKRF